MTSPASVSKTTIAIFKVSECGAKVKKRKSRITTNGGLQRVEARKQQNLLWYSTCVIVSLYLDKDLRILKHGIVVQGDEIENFDLKCTYLTQKKFTF